MYAYNINNWKFEHQRGCYSLSIDKNCNCYSFKDEDGCKQNIDCFWGLNPYNVSC